MITTKRALSRKYCNERFYVIRQFVCQIWFGMWKCDDFLIVDPLSKAMQIITNSLNISLNIFEIVIFEYSVFTLCATIEIDIITFFVDFDVKSSMVLKFEPYGQTISKWNNYTWTLTSFALIIRIHVCRSYFFKHTHSHISLGLFAHSTKIHSHLTTTKKRKKNSNNIARRQIIHFKVLFFPFSWHVSCFFFSQNQQKNKRCRQLWLF